MKKRKSVHRLRVVDWDDLVRLLLQQLPQYAWASQGRRRETGSTRKDTKYNDNK